MARLDDGETAQDAAGVRRDLNTRTFGENATYRLHWGDTIPPPAPRADAAATAARPAIVAMNRK